MKVPWHPTKGVSSMVETNRRRPYKKLQDFCLEAFARALKITEVTPVLKSGNWENLSNIRLISFLSILSKICEHLAYGQFTDYLIESN